MLRPLFRRIRVLAALLTLASTLKAELFASPAAPQFYVPANPRFTVLYSAEESVRFTLGKTLQLDKAGHLFSVSSFVNPEGVPMKWHDFGTLEGPGWAANAVGGAWESYRLGGFLHKPDWQSNAVSILDHVLESGFIDEQSGFIRGYRDLSTGQFCLNYKHNSDWFCPGSMAKVAFQLLSFADDLGPTARSTRMRTMALRCAEWLDGHVESVPSGWYPRRVDQTGKLYRKSPEGGQDALWDSSADGLYIVQLEAALTEHGLADYRPQLRSKTAVFVQAGGIFGSINQDTYDPLENVACSVAFRTLRATARVLKDESLREFAFGQCLGKLDQFKMREDRNGVATQGLLYMEKSWDTAYLWENAEAALAYFEAALDTRKTQPKQSRAYERDGLVILRAIARHHYGAYGFLTEGVDWNDHVGQQHHIGRAKFGAIQYTEPFLNNQHIVEPTVFYLENLAKKKTGPGKSQSYFDLEGNLLYRGTAQD